VLWPALRDGLPFSLTLLFILGVHEMGHYVVARLHGAKVTLPFFIPLPVSGTLGTLGAVIFIRSPLMNRRALFDVGIAGPLAGMVIAIPAFLIGLQQPQTLGGPVMWMDAGITRVANPPLLDMLARLVVDTHNLDRFVFFGHPMALAAWFGVLLTALNLLPMGQFDGGHVLYALLGRRAWTVARFVFVGLVLLGVFGFWFTWLIWAMMGLLTGLRHPPPHDDLTPLGWPRTLLGIATVILFVLIFVPIPFYAP
jgi:membrane-associated protease RseP (regulator of RpoE activity)